MRLLLSAFLLVLAGCALAAGEADMALAWAGVVIGVALAATVALDALWLNRKSAEP